MTTYLFMLDDNYNFITVIIFADSIARAVDRLLDMVECKEYNILSITIRN